MSRLSTALVVVVALTVAGCGNYDDDDDKTAATGGDARGVTDDTIKVGGLSTLQPPGGQPPFPGLDDGARARIERANRDGELKHKIDFIGVKDDAADQATNAKEARDLVLNEKVFAVLPFVTQVAAGSGDFLNDEKVPFIGWGFTPSSCTEYGVGDTGCIGPGAEQLDLSLAKPLGDVLGGAEGKTAVVFAENYAGSSDNLDNMVKVFENAGFDVVLADGSLPPDTAGPVTDFSPYVQKVMTADNGNPPDLMVNNTNFGNAIGVTGALNAAGFKGAQVNYVSYVPGLLEAAPDLAQALEGSYIVQQGTGAQVAGGPSWKQIESDLEEVGADPFVQLGTIHGYASADMFIQVVKKLEEDGEEITPENFAAVFDGDWTYPGMDGAIGTAAFPVSRKSANNCSSTVQVKDGAYVSVTELTCDYGLVPR
jgi:ABC-type branched-subunit amino acid transport system substrate-binding protein